MTQQVALYGFVRYRDGLRVRPLGVDDSRCYLYYGGGDSAAVISTVPGAPYEPSLSSMVSHDEAVEKIYTRQTILPAKFPKLLSIKALEKSMDIMDPEIGKALKKMLFKSEYRVKILMTDENNRRQNPSTDQYNAFSKFFLQNADKYQFRHYFPTLTTESKEAEFVHYTETVVRQISNRLARLASYWRIRSFQSEIVFLDAYFWVRKSKNDEFLDDVNFLQNFYPNLKISVFGPTPPYNFVNIDFQKTLL